MFSSFGRNLASIRSTVQRTSPLSLDHSIYSNKQIRKRFPYPLRRRTHASGGLHGWPEAKLRNSGGDGGRLGNGIRPGSIPLLWGCLLVLSLPCAAQALPDTAAARPDDTTANTTVASASSAAVPSLEELGLVPSVAVADPGSKQAQVPATSATPIPPKNSVPPAASSSDALSLQDLGFSSSQTQANAQLQARLNKRTHMLKIHQTMGLLTAIPLYATVLVSNGAKPKIVHTASGGSITVLEPTSASVDLHVALGSLTVAMYGTTAYFAIRAPKVAGTPSRGAIRLHKYLVYIHGPGMILTPILGEMALSQESQGQKVHGIASAHAAVAATTVIAYTAAIISVSWPIHLKFF